MKMLAEEELGHMKQKSTSANDEGLFQMRDYARGYVMIPSPPMTDVTHTSQSRSVFAKLPLKIQR